MTKNRAASDVRIEGRRPYQCVVQISWHTRAGETRSARAKCLDLSAEGARIECSQPIDLRANVYLQAAAHGLMGDATVRYCVRAGLKYHIGLLFNAASSLADKGRKHCLRESRPQEKGYHV